MNNKFGLQLLMQSVALIPYIFRLLGNTKYNIHKKCIEKTDLNVSNLFTAFLLIKTAQGSYVTRYSKFHILTAFLDAILIYSINIPGFGKMHSTSPARRFHL